MLTSKGRGKGKGRRSGGRINKMRKAKQSLHGVKKFVCHYKMFDVVTDISGTNVGGYKRYDLSIDWGKLPNAIKSSLGGLYRQFAFTGVKYEYRALNTTPMPSENQPAGEMLFAVNKSLANLTAEQLKVDDNCKVLKTSRNFNHYVKNPRPALYQVDGTGNRFLAIQRAKEITWLDTGNTLQHFTAGFATRDDYTVTALAPVQQGELWAKVYIVCKEQVA